MLFANFLKLDIYAMWETLALVLLFFVGFWLTCAFKCFQFTHVIFLFRHTIGSLLKFGKKQQNTLQNKNIETKNVHSLSQFQSVCTALAATLGTGNIVGVASAIAVGGAGAVFWMWVMAFLGMMTAFTENVLGIYYRKKNKDGSFSGGAMYTLENGLGKKRRFKFWGILLAQIFAMFCLLASFGMGNMLQANAISGNISYVFGLSPIVTGIILCALTAVVLLGGVSRIGAITEKLVPAMAFVYIVGAVIVIFAHRQLLPMSFCAIFKGAFDFSAFSGGAIGTAIIQGFKRGAFSNEAGLGSSVIVHATTAEKEPTVQGMWAMFEVFFDTILTCSLTAIVILSSGFVNLQTGKIQVNIDATSAVAAVFSDVFGSFGAKAIAICILLFAYSTLLGWSHYGAEAFAYLFGKKYEFLFKAFYIGAIYLGATMTLQKVYVVSDLFNSLMMIPNLVCVFALAPMAQKIAKNYLDRTLFKKPVEAMLHYED